ncbi:MAG TPA: ATP-binding protein [Polyangia bacterium]|jgi:PAS domain S-box-containing protein|nr:ATP-binding protein [Polyangia bacterium]
MDRGKDSTTDGIDKSGRGDGRPRGPSGGKRRAADETERVVHDLELHTLELDQQNEELRRTTDNLEAAVAQYFELYDHAPVGYFTLDTEGTIRRVNVPGAALLGLERADLMHHSLRMFVAPEDREAFTDLIAQVFGPLGKGYCEVALHPAAHASGGQSFVVAPEPIQVQLTATRSDGEDECRIVVVDVTAQTKALRALRDSEQLFRTLVEAMEDSVITVDRHERILSARWRRLDRLGIPASSFIGKTVTEVYGPDVGAGHAAAHARVLDGEPAVHEWSHQVEGTQVRMQTVSSPLRDGHGQITGFLDVSRDVTELKRMHEEVLMSARMSSLGVLAAGIAHEINNPLSVVVANLDAARSQLRQAADQATPAPPYLGDTLELLADCAKSAEHVRLIVDDLRLFSRPDEKSQTEVDLRKVVATAIALAKNEIRHRAALITEYGDIPLIHGNEARLGQVVLNLLINATQALPEGQVDKHAITVRTLTHESGCALVEVLNTGPSIPQEVLARIFEPFFTTKPIGFGTGLGLAICKQVVTAAGGQITVDSDLGQGTRFRLLFPGAPAKRPELTIVPTVTPAPGRRARILLIDDDPDVLRVTARVLSQRHEVVAVLRAQDAIDKVSSGEPFDLIISDLMMPVVTGMELHRTLLQLAPEHARRMIFLTGGAFTPSAREFLNRVDNLRVDKPYDRRNLLALVDRLVK